MKRYNLILFEYEFMPNALEVFENEFEKIIGKTVKVFKELAVCNIEQDGMIVYELDMHRLSQTLSDPYWILEIIEEK